MKHPLIDPALLAEQARALIDAAAEAGAPLRDFVALLDSGVDSSDRASSKLRAMLDGDPSSLAASKPEITARRLAWARESWASGARAPSGRIPPLIRAARKDLLFHAALFAAACPELVLERGLDHAAFNDQSGEGVELDALSVAAWHRRREILRAWSPLVEAALDGPSARAFSESVLGAALIAEAGFHRGDDERAERFDLHRLTQGWLELSRAMPLRRLEREVERVHAHAAALRERLAPARAPGSGSARLGRG